jgi:hypothetical protein
MAIRFVTKKQCECRYDLTPEARPGGKDFARQANAGRSDRMPETGFDVPQRDDRDATGCDIVPGDGIR